MAAEIWCLSGWLTGIFGCEWVDGQIAKGSSDSGVSAS